jgi:hypothetical protein
VLPTVGDKSMSDGVRKQAIWRGKTLDFEKIKFQVHELKKWVGTYMCQNHTIFSQKLVSKLTKNIYLTTYDNY